MNAEVEGQAGEGEEDGDSGSDLDSWLVSDSSDEQEDAAGVHALKELCAVLLPGFILSTFPTLTTGSSLLLRCIQRVRGCGRRATVALIKLTNCLDASTG